MGIDIDPKLQEGLQLVQEAESLLDDIRKISPPPTLLWRILWSIQPLESSLTGRLYQLRREYERLDTYFTVMQKVGVGGKLAEARALLLAHLNEASDRLSEIRNERSFTRSSALSAVSVFVAFISICWTVGTFAADRRRAFREQILAKQARLNGLAFELRADDETCRDMIEGFSRMLAAKGSPAWSLRNSRLNESLRFDFDDNDDAYAALLLTDDLIAGANSHARFLDNGTLDLMQNPQHDRHLRLGLTNLRDACINLRKQIAFTTDLVDAHAEKHGLQFKQILFSSLNYYPHPKQ